MVRLRLYPIEKIVLAFTLLALGLYPAFGIPFRHPAALYRERIIEAAAYYAVGLVIAALVCRLRRTSFRSEYLRRDRFIRDARLLNGFALTFVVFIQLKHLIPFINPRSWDALAIDSERALLGGKLAAEWLREWLRLAAAPVISDAYMFFYPFMAIVIVYSVIQRDESLAQRFAAAFALVWFLGIVAVYAAPTLGPCFAIPGFNDLVPDTHVGEMQRQLWRHKLFIEQHPASPNGVWLISGFPSLHLAVPILALFAFLPRQRLIGLLALGTALATVVSTLYFGWHYLVDDLGAAALARAAWQLSRPPKSPSTPGK